MGDIYTLDLKGVWEEFYPDMSFPQFKYWYFNSNSNSKNKTNIMPTIRSSIFPRQKIIIEAKHDLLLSELREQILQDFEYIADKLYSKFKKQYFTIEDFAKSICEKYGITKARIIANSLFDLVDPNGWCVKYRSESPFENVYSLSNGNFKEFMRRSIIKSNVMHNITKSLDTSSYEGYVSLISDNTSTTALKLLSVFDYITYEVVGGEEPEIFIRLNDPHKIKSIVLGHTKYSNNYATKAKQKHDRDVSILLQFFNDLKTDDERWDYIENYFLGNDVLDGIEPVSQNFVKMCKSIDKEHSYPANQYQNWLELEPLFDESDRAIIKKLSEIDIPLPQYLETTIKHSEEGECILISWSTKNVLICKQDTSDNTLKYFSRKGLYAYRIHEIDYDDLKNMFY